MFKRLAASALVFGMAALAPPALSPALAQSVHNVQSAQSACAPRDAVVAKLSLHYKEARVGAGLAGEQSVFELWTSEETGSWTLTRTSIKGVTCIMAAGDAWTPVTMAKGVKS